MEISIDGHKLGQTLGDGEGQESLACCSPWGLKESDTTEQLNYNSDSKQYVSFPGAKRVK